MVQCVYSGFGKHTHCIHSVYCMPVCCMGNPTFIGIADLGAGRSG